MNMPPIEIAHLIATHQLQAVFQPIGRLDDSAVYAHEALIRGPAGTPLAAPDALFALAQAQDQVVALEQACLCVVLQRWSQLRGRGRLFVNLSAWALVQLTQHDGTQSLKALLHCWGVLPRHVVVELTEQGSLPPLDVLVQAVHAVRQLGAAVALDDFGQGTSNLNLWSVLRPEVVKIDKFFVQGLAADADKADTVRALQRMAQIFGAELVAEGIETDADLRLLRELGLTLGQGYFLGRPAACPVSALAAPALAVLASRQVAIVPEVRAPSSVNLFERLQIVDAPALSSHTACMAVAELFQSQPLLHAVALVDEGQPVGLINRLHFFNQFSKLYYRELWGKKSCIHLANQQPRLIEMRQSMDELLGILTSDDQRYLSDGFIVLENGHYKGLCRGEHVVKAVTEMRIEAARHANPLTFLPGNIPITQHLERLLARGSDFVVCYLDLNYFKSFNDRYGYWRGDEMILLVAQVAREHVHAQRDFLGHVGGDDFVIVYQDPQWLPQCRRMIEAFNARAALLFDPTDRAHGGIESEDRQGVVRFFPLTSLSIGVVEVAAGQFRSAQDVANAAASAKHEAKKSTDGLARHALQDAAIAAL
ncbi:GGDEF domain-containing protein [Rhodoferax sp.]|uniref:GGDEF domain-containing protein n=1 Tax=Rhodoferax sp. TaxID=50421 RepID=UPI002638CB10|nr:GGDEF domain-containing protein [Rhodoferax sp.]MDD2808323.1 GGDEF domain-containing protein [Rhodoferax sp.]MDD4942934.1 GGDEF domain-containing protein [Rhodoferax sp.]